jgi:hypothetical protein
LPIEVTHMVFRSWLPPTLLVLLALLAVTASSAPAQTRRWRVGVAGGYCNGYWGTLGQQGLPRERMLDRRVTDLAYLRQFDVVIIGIPPADAAATSRAVEQFVAGGGVAITEQAVQPSAQVLPGRRITQPKGPNARFLNSPWPGCEKLGAVGLLGTQNHPGASIVADPSRPDTYILARFTDEGAKDELKGIFVDGGQGTPAVIAFRHGKGWWLWFGIYSSFWTTLVGPQYESVIVNGLRNMTGGELTSHWALRPPRGGLLTQAGGDDGSAASATPNGPGRFTMPGPEWQALDDNLALAGDYDLTATLPTGGQAEVVSAWWCPTSYRSVQFAPDAVSIGRVDAGQRTELARATLPAGPGPRQVHVRRRTGMVTVRVDGSPLLQAWDGPPQKGMVACRGLGDATCQPATPAEFNDDFMRTPSEQSPWEVLSGKWEIQQDVGDLGKSVPRMSANPFRYQATSPADGPARASVGSWSWGDYQAEASVRPTCQVVGIAACQASAGDYLLFRVPVVKKAGVPGQAELVDCAGGQPRVIASAPCAALWDQWCRPGIRVSGGYVQGLMDGKVVLQSIDVRQAPGPVGLLAEGGAALFDDVVVQPWQALPVAVGAESPARWDVAQGTCQPAAGGALQVAGSPQARVMSPWTAHDCWLWTYVTPGAAGEAGLLARSDGPDNGYLLGLSRQGAGQTRAVLRRREGARERLLSETALDSNPDAEHLLQMRLADQHIQAWVDGQQVADLLDDGPDAGAMGLWARDGQATFRSPGGQPVAGEVQLVDDLTPGFAGIIDKHIWAGRAPHLFADPDDLGLYWHRGEYPHDVCLKVGVSRAEGEPVTVGSLFLGDGQDPAAGYELRVTRTWDAGPVQLEVYRRGVQVAQGTVTMSPRRDRFVLEGAVQRTVLVLRLDGREVLQYADPEPLDTRRVGLKLTGSLVVADDTCILTPDVRVYTFSASPTDWVSESGTWDVASRWTCTPGWTWFCGWGDGDVWTTSKEAFSGDQRLDMFVGAKMMAVPGGTKETLRDVRLGLCVTPGDAQSGYRFVYGGRGNSWTAIVRNGEVVARTTWGLPEGGMHNDWTLVSAVKRGSVVSLEWEGNELLRYDDPSPLEGGHVALGTRDNGILTPKVSIYGQVY